MGISTYLAVLAGAYARAGEKKLPIGVPLPDITMDQFMDIEDGWSAREERV
jgi:hypothetical protein